MIENAFKNIAVVGAAGKMGSGIALLILQEMALLEAASYGTVGGNGYQLHLIEANIEAFSPLKNYLRTQLVKMAEKNINKLRGLYAKNPRLVSNEEIIRNFVDGSLDNIFLATSLKDAKDASIVFEAIVEDIEIKTKVLSELSTICSKDTIYYSNTSSIPISLLDKASNLNHHLIGFHFYNPPTMHKIVEVVLPAEIPESARKLTYDVGKILGKTLIPSKDIAGFIGNGYLMREIIFSCDRVREMAENMPLHVAIYLVNKVTQDFLIRPMGIFQLVDYIGIDIVISIGKIMSTYLLNNNFEEEILLQMLELGIKGGQYSDGSQKEGFFTYEHNVPTAVYSPAVKSYVPFDDEEMKKGAEMLGPLPQGHLSWKKLSHDKDKKEKLRLYFHDLFEADTAGAELAKAYLLEMREIAHDLIKNEVVRSLEDLEAILEQGFFHLYGPEDPFK